MKLSLLPDFLAIGGLVVIFMSLLRRTHQTRMRYWFVGWALILAHIVFEFLAINIQRGSDPIYAASTAMLLLASVAFIWAAQGSQLASSRDLGRMTLAEAPNLAFVFCLYGGIEATSVYAGLIAAGALWSAWSAWAFNAGGRASDRSGRTTRLLGIVAVYAIQAAILVYGSSEDAMDWMLCWHYLAVALFFWMGSPRASTGVVFTTASFIAWALVFPIAALLYHLAPAVHIENEVWNLPKFLVATGMILTLLEEQMYKAELAAMHDALTGLPNRRLFDERLRQAFEQAQRSHKKVALVVIDLDHFKQTNDSLGHQAGDDLLRAVAACFARSMRASDTLARIGGDEFVAILGDLPSRAAAERVLDALQHSLRQPLVIQNQSVTVSASMGMSLFPDDCSDPVQLLATADQRMYAAKLARRPAVT